MKTFLQFVAAAICAAGLVGCGAAAKESADARALRIYLQGLHRDASGDGKVLPAVKVLSAVPAGTTANFQYKDEVFDRIMWRDIRDDRRCSIMETNLSRDKMLVAFEKSGEVAVVYTEYKRKPPPVDPFAPLRKK